MLILNKKEILSKGKNLLEKIGYDEIKSFKKLEELGWCKERKINIKVHVEILENCGFEVFDVAKQFIEEFGDLDIKVKGKVSSTSVLILSTYVKRILEVFNECNDKDIIRKKYFDLSKYTDEKVIPVGTLSNGEMIIFITESGRLVTETVIKGENVVEGLNAIISRKAGKAWTEVITEDKKQDFEDIMARLQNGEIFK